MTTLTRAVDATDHSIGPDNAAVTLVEYGNYDCPHCQRVMAVTIALLKEFNAEGRNGLRLVYRPYPRETLRSPSQLAAEGAEAAAAQGKFWEMHEHLLRNQGALAETNLLAYAMIIGLDRQRFATELENHDYAPLVREKFLGGRESGVLSTPTFFINGIRHDGDWDVNTLRTAISAASGQWFVAGSELSGVNA